MSFFFAMKKGDDDENKFSPPTPKIIEPKKTITMLFLFIVYNFKTHIIKP